MFARVVVALLMLGALAGLARQFPPPAPQFQPQAEKFFTPAAADRRGYVLQGDVGVNVRAALNANGGRIRRFSIAPGETWSFGRSIAPISAMAGQLVDVSGVYAGGWCDLSAMYLRVALRLRLRADYPQHAGISEPFPGIWLNEDGSGADLRITNTLSRPVRFQAIEDGGELIIEGGIE